MEALIESEMQRLTSDELYATGDFIHSQFPKTEEFIDEKSVIHIHHDEVDSLDLDDNPEKALQRTSIFKHG